MERTQSLVAVARFLEWDSVLNHFYDIGLRFQVTDEIMWKACHR